MPRCATPSASCGTARKQIPHTPRSDGIPIGFSQNLTDLLGGQCDAGFVITDLYEDTMLDSPLHNSHPGYIATRAVKTQLAL